MQDRAALWSRDENYQVLIERLKYAPLLPTASASAHALQAWRPPGSIVACLDRSCTRKDSLYSRATRHRSLEICACQSGRSPAERHGHRARWRHLRRCIHPVIGTPRTGGGRAQTLLNARGTRVVFLGAHGDAQRVENHRARPALTNATRMLASIRMSSVRITC
jgi:hypothetical protein